MTRQRVPVTTRALVQRIDRKLKAENRRLHATRPNTRAWAELGDYYIRDVARQNIIETHVDVEEKAKQLGVLAEWEKHIAQ